MWSVNSGKNNWIVPQPPAKKTDKKVTIVNSDPANLTTAQQLARINHDIVVLEKETHIDDLLRYNIPDFKMEKSHIDHHITQMETENVQFRVNQNIDVNVRTKNLLAEYDTIILTDNAEYPRDLPIPDRELNGVHFAMDFLTPQNKIITNDKAP
jgi:NADPH-dependent glutamate synthase beta chain and related oxidoreductases